MAKSSDARAIKIPTSSANLITSRTTKQPSQWAFSDSLARSNLSSSTTRTTLKQSDFSPNASNIATKLSSDYERNCERTRFAESAAHALLSQLLLCAAHPAFRHPKGRQRRQGVLRLYWLSS